MSITGVELTIFSTFARNDSLFICGSIIPPSRCRPALRVASTQTRLNGVRHQFHLTADTRDTYFPPMGYTPQLWMALPFLVLLALIALGPLLFERWWLKHYPKICFSLGALTVAWYLLALPPAAAHKVVHTGVEYISFIALIGSLFVVSGGIHINVKGEAT